MVIVHAKHSKAKFMLEGAMIDLPEDNKKIWASYGVPTEDFKDWMHENVGRYAKDTVAYTIHNMGWCVVPFLGQRRDYTPIVVRYPEKLMLIKLAWF